MYRFWLFADVERESISFCYRAMDKVLEKSHPVADGFDPRSI